MHCDSASSFRRSIWRCLSVRSYSRAARRAAFWSALGGGFFDFERCRFGPSLTSPARSVGKAACAGLINFVATSFAPNPPWDRGLSLSYQSVTTT